MVMGKIPLISVYFAMVAKLYCTFSVALWRSSFHASGCSADECGPYWIAASICSRVQYSHNLLSNCAFGIVEGSVKTYGEWFSYVSTSICVNLPSILASSAEHVLSVVASSLMRIGYGRMPSMPTDTSCSISAAPCEGGMGNTLSCLSYLHPSPYLFYRIPFYFFYAGKC